MQGLTRSLRLFCNSNHAHLVCKISRRIIDKFISEWYNVNIENVDKKFVCKIVYIFFV